MGWISGIAVYLCIWWVVIFAVLPWGVRTAEPNGRGFDPGAPDNPRLLRKVVTTSLISAVIWGGVYALVTTGFFSFRSP
jgi:predicted secreted protein